MVKLAKNTGSGIWPFVAAGVVSLIVLAIGGVIGSDVVVGIGLLGLFASVLVGSLLNGSF